MINEICIKVNEVSKKYNLYNSPADRLKEVLHIGEKCRHQEYYALDKVSFSVKKGETFGIIGTNGAGKSTLLKLITGVASATTGTIEVNGKVSALLELGAGFNPEYSGIENIYLNGVMMGFSREEMSKKIEGITEFADIGDFINQPVKTYSSGMFARLAFAVAINVKPDILIVDEALSVGDVFFQNKCYKKFEELRALGTTILFVSHDISTVKQMCSKVLWIERGKQMMLGESVEVCNAYSNSILEKRSEEFNKIKKEEIEEMGESYKSKNNEQIDLSLFPQISFNKESILSDKVKIHSCMVFDENEDIVTELDVNKKYKVSVIFESKIQLESCIVGFVLETIKGLWVINTNSAINGNKTGIFVIENSINRVDFIFEMPAIMNGDYVLGVAVSEGNQNDYKVLSWLYHVLYIRVNNDALNSAVIDVPTEIRVTNSVFQNK